MDTPEPRAAVEKKGQLYVFDESPAAHFQAGFDEIAKTRMAGLPIMNPRLQVKADNFRRWGNDWIGSVVTPWSILVVYACGNADGWVSVPPGKTRTMELPSGDYPFLGCLEPMLGEYQMLGLISPLTEIENQEAAEEIARIAMQTMLTVPEDAKWDEEEEGIPLSSPTGRKAIPIKAVEPGTLKEEAKKPISRRDFFRRYTHGAKNE